MNKYSKLILSRRDNNTLQKSIKVIRKAVGKTKITACLVLGSGWGQIAAMLNSKIIMDYEDIPALNSTILQGHAGKLHISEIQNKKILIFEGRHHWYEGRGWLSVIFPSLACNILKIGYLVLTNAAGSLCLGLCPGDLMAITDHINLIGNPLTQYKIGYSANPFLSLSSVYDKDLLGYLMNTAVKNRLPLKKGVYVAVPGPFYETPSESHALAKLGGDAVGMSTVPEAITAYALGIKITALSCISNYAAGITKETPDHHSITQVVSSTLEKINKLLFSFLKVIT